MNSEEKPSMPGFLVEQPFMNDRNYAGSCDFDSPEPAKLTRKILRIKNSHNGGCCVTCPCCGHVSLFQVAHPLKTEDILNPEALSGDSLREIESGREFRKLPCGDQVTVCRKCGGMFLISIRMMRHCGICLLVFSEIREWSVGTGGKLPVPGAGFPIISENPRSG